MKQKETKSIKIFRIVPKIYTFTALKPLNLAKFVKSLLYTIISGANEGGNFNKNYEGGIP